MWSTSFRIASFRTAAAGYPKSAHSELAHFELAHSEMPLSELARPAWFSNPAARLWIALCAASTTLERVSPAAAPCPGLDADRALNHAERSDARPRSAVRIPS